MSESGKNIVDIDDKLRLVGTAHISSASVDLVRSQIEEWSPDLVAVELCESRKASLLEPDALDNADLLKILNDGKSHMILLQSALAAEQRRMGISSGEKPGAELLAAIEAAEDAEIPVELIDRDVLITLRRAWAKMGFLEKFRVLDALLWQEDDEEGATVEELLEDSDMLSKLMEEAREVAPAAGSVLIDERDAFLAGRIQQIRGRGKILAIVGAGHLDGIQKNLAEPAMETASRIAELSVEPRKSKWPKAVMIAIPLFLFGAVAWMGYNGEMEAIKQTAVAWLAINAGLTGLGVLLARGHLLSVLVGAMASPITSLNPFLAAGWFAGYTQLKVTPPTGGDAQEFLDLNDLSLFWKNRVGKVLMVTAMGNLGSVAGTWIAAAGIASMLL
ncbi:MAG: conjugal transfer protein TraB [Euryarchaeota archaeon]|nr:conjugal transfer protein TraB [Euryarchaeota archaeon]MBK33769.1 conjugal transfer protein TraB [Chloroflexota bacterium]DAC36815.1 MAG TPA: TraB/GumN family protein [Candidatus Poseidoniales archaeon]HIH56580.1 TraB/GumN family protein [Candidatus Thalassarchaeum sp.]|tara:strand:- start:2012 stop:3178 length:1167 start_codon:yes stop_codon:yes gene_type:complete